MSDLTLPAQPATPKPVAPKATAAVRKTAIIHFEEWQCQINTILKNGEAVKEYEKLKKTRSPIVISDEEAEILNDGVLNGNNNYGKMYFKPE